ncbi:MAG: hypothetical protein IJS54_02290 [Desulfovibrio sp.]|nr:hypothetical protein [Desulfovibrio sp.]
MESLAIAPATMTESLTYTKKGVPMKALGRSIKKGEKEIEEAEERVRMALLAKEGLGTRLSVTV